MTTTIATLSIERIWPTRIVRRRIEVSTATPLPAVATIIRAAKGWWNTRRAFAFVVNATTLHEHEGKGRRAHQREERILLLDWG